MTRFWKFGTTADGTTVTAFEIQSETGCRAVILDRGAILQSFVLPNGRNVTLGFETWPEYEQDRCYVGRIIGPNANRIFNARFHIDDREVSLAANEGAHNLHSGPNGFDVQSWKAQPFETGLIFSLKSAEGYHGFPGAMDVTLRITLHRNCLKLEMQATSNRATPMNMTWHPYWILSGERIDGHDLQVSAEFHSKPDRKADLPVKNTKFDFRKYLPLGTVALDTNYRSVGNASLVSDTTSLHITSSLPDMQVYTGDSLPRPRSGIALEPQYRPNDINFDQNSLLRPDKTYHHWIEYRFDFS